MGIRARHNSIRRFIAGIAIAALAITGQNLIAISASAAEADSANSPVDYAAVFDGTTANPVAAASDTIIPASTAFTVEAWIYPTATDANDRVVLSQGTSAGGEFFIKRTNGDLYVYRTGFPSGNALDCGPVIDNAWTHIAVSMDGSTVKCYFNGSVSFIKNLGFGNNIASKFVVGAWANLDSASFNFWKGQLDQIKVWNAALSESQVAESMHSYSSTGVTGAPTLLAHYDFNEGSNADGLAYNRAGAGLDLSAAALTYADVKTVVTGGNIDSARTVVYKFPRTYLTAQGGWTIPANLTRVETLVVGAGGGGGENVGNGGSGGSVAYHSGISPAAGSVISVKVGQGGRPGVYVDDSMVGTTNATFQQDASGVVNSAIVSTQRDGGDGQASVVSLGGVTMNAPGGLGGQTYWSDNKCNGTGHTDAVTAAGAMASGGTTNAVGATGGMASLNGAGNPGTTSTNVFTISGVNYRYGAGGAGASGMAAPASAAGGGDGGGASASSANVSTSVSRGGNGAANSGSGGSGGLTACTPGGAGGSGVVYIRTLSPKVNAVTGSGGSANTLSGYVAGPDGNFSLALSSTAGTLNITAAALTASGATKTGGSGTDKFITYRGTIPQLNLALNSTKLTLQNTLGSGSIKLELNPIVANTATTFFNQENGHYYRSVATTLDWASAKAAAENAGSNLLGLNGYLTNVTSAAEKDFIFANISATTLWSGGYYNGTNWIWEGGPEAGTAFWSGINLGTAIAGQYANWGTGEPNGTQDRVVVNWTSSNGVWDNQTNTTQNPYLVEFGGRSTDPGVTTANVTVTLSTVNVAFIELNFDYTAGRYVNLKKLNVDGTDATLAGTTISATDSTGKNIGDRVLFKGVTVRDGRTIDAIVTTRRVVNATVKNYESGTGAGGANSNFQADVDISAANGYAEFQFDYFETDANLVANCNASIACTGSNKVILQNVNVSLIDIDYYQWNDITGMDSYTVSNPTNLKECLVSTLTPTTTCTARASITNFPAEIRFQGPTAIDATIPQDMAIANYGSMETFRVKFGRSASGTPNYYGIAFKALSWGTAVPQTFGPPAVNYNLTYDGNGSTSGTVPATQTGPIGSSYTIATNSGVLAKTGYTFGGWNSSADGTGTAYAASTAFLMPLGGLTLYAQWVPNQYTLTYDANGGSSAPASSLNNAGALLTLSATTPTRAGYTFAGWNTAANGSGTNYAASAAYTMPGVNTTLYAKWSAATATIAYNGNGSASGSVPASTTATAGSATTVSANSGNLVNTGYSFAGWNTAANGSGTDYAAGAAINYPASGTTTLYAKWTANSYTLAYNSNGGSSSPGSTSQQFGSTVTVISAASNPTRAGYTFNGWNTAANGSGTSQAAASTFSMPASNVTLYAQWTAINYNVTYSSNAPSGSTATGSQTDPANYISGASVTVANAGTLAVASYRFVGWNTRADGTGTDYAPGASFTMPVGGITLYAKWMLSSVQLTYDSNGGSAGPAPDIHAAGSQIQLSSVVPTRAGYTFGGWNTLANGSGTNYASAANYTVPGSDTVLYAKWTAINYSLTYDANGGSGSPAALLNQIVNAVITLSNSIPSWVGYTFLGWNTAANGSGTDFTPGGLFTMGAGNATLYAKWQGDPFTLYYNGNGGTTISPASEGRTAGAVGTISSSVPTRSGYNFNGWNTRADGTGTSYTAGSSLTMPGQNLTLYAQWSAAVSAVNYDANGGSNAPLGSYATTNQTITVSAGVPTRSGFTFVGWNTAANGSGTPYSAGDTLVMSSNSITFYAQWSTSSYVLSYDANGGASAPANQNVAYAATATVSSALPTRAGFDFLGWNTDMNGLGTSRPGGSTFVMPVGNVTLYAQWALATYTVYYNANGGLGNIASQAGRFGSNIALTSVLPTRAGYTFAGWNTNADGTGTAYAAGAGFTIPSSNTMLYAQWTAITYTLTYDDNGGTGSPAAVTGKTAGENFNLSATLPTRSGYYFAGWNTLADGSGQSFAASAPYVMPPTAVTLYAKWALNTYNVTYNANGGSGAPASQQTDGSGNVTVPNTTPVRPGYTFTGWNTIAAGSGTSRAIGVTFAPGANLVLYAQWTANNITVSYDINGGTGSTPPLFTGAYGSVIQLEGSGGFTKANYVFVAWNTQADGNGISYQADEPNYALPTADVTLYAIWAGTNFAIEYRPNGGGNAPGTQYATPGTNVNVAPAAPVLDGHDFAGWQDVSTGNVYSAGTPITMPTSNVVLVARWFARASLPRVTPTPTPTPTTPAPPVVAPKKLTLTVYFKGDSAVLTSATKIALTRLAAKAKTYGTASAITVIGRVKETNDKSYDARLSKQRATNVAVFLRKLGVTGTYRVIAAGISPENKPVSRRVDTTLVWNK